MLELEKLGWIKEEATTGTYDQLYNLEDKCIYVYLDYFELSLRVSVNFDDIGVEHIIALGKDLERLKEETDI